VQDDSDSYTSPPYIFHPTTSFSFISFLLLFFYVCAALSNGLCIKLHNKVICTLFPGSLFRSSY
jgi:hypothetical protein